MHHERRRHERLPVNFYVEQVVATERRREAPARIHNNNNSHRHEEGEASRRHFATDISLSGVYIEQPRSLQAEPSTFLQLQIPLPGTPEAISASAEVVFARKDLLFRGSGLRFVEMSPIHARWLREWLHENAWTDRVWGIGVFRLRSRTREAAGRSSA